MTSLRDHVNYSGREGLIKQFKRESPNNYEEFLEVLYDDLDFAISLIESDSKDFFSSGEDVLNREIVRLLRARGQIASHDHDEGGHVDVRVASQNGEYSWLAEAKLDNGAAYLLGGINQLTERYVKGTPNHNQGGFLVYIQRPRCSERFQQWKNKISEEGSRYENLTVETCERRENLAFYSSFVLNRMGKEVPPYKIRHVAVSVYREASNKD